MNEKDPILVVMESICDKMEHLNDIADRLCTIFDKRDLSRESTAIKRSVQEFSRSSIALSKEMEKFGQLCGKLVKL